MIWDFVLFCFVLFVLGLIFLCMLVLCCICWYFDRNFCCSPFFFFLVILSKTEVPYIWIDR